MISVKRKPEIEVKNITIQHYTETPDETFQDLEGGKPKIYGKEPLLWYNGTEIAVGDISSFYLDTNGFMPRLQVYLYDNSSLMNNPNFALDNTIISLYIDSRTNDTGNNPALRPIRMDFKIIDYGFIEKEGLFFIQGIPDVDNLYTQFIRSYPEKTSYQVLDRLAEELKLGFSSNVSGSNDSMNWSNMNFENYQFIKDVTTKSYIDDNSFMTTFVDYYYSLNYVNIENQFKEDIKEQKGMLTANSEGLDEIEGGQIVADLFLVNKDSYDSGFNNTYDSYEILNKSTKVSLKNGYRTDLYYYDRTGNWSENGGTFLKFTLETNTDGQGIILKSFPNDTNDGGFFNSNTKSVYLPPLDVDNVHKNYNYADILNAYNIDEINKVSIKVVLSQPNFNFYKYQKTKIIIMENTVIKNEKLTINHRLSGAWVITAINFSFTPGVGLKQEMVMVKRELNTNGNLDV